MEQQPTNHPAVHIGAVDKLLELLKAESSLEKLEELPWARYEELRDKAAAAAQAGVRAHDEVDRVMFEKGYRLLQHGGEKVRPTTNAPPPWISGLDVLRDGDPPSRRRRLLAHLHGLAFPEVGELLELFAYPGKPASIVQTRRDNFVFWRKLNQVTADYVASELREFGLLQRQADESFCAVRASPPILAGIVVRKYLVLADHRVDQAVDIGDLLSQAGGVLPPRLFDGHPADSAWLRALRAPGGVFLQEVGGSRVRLGLEGLCWFAEAGIASPLDCGKVLRQRRAKESLARVREALIKRMAELRPINMSAIEIALQPA
jgi:hypothetical protein